MNPAALITGSAKRIGKAFALALAERGYDIAVHYNRSRSEAEEVCGEAESKGVRCKVFSGDLSNPNETLQLAVEVRRRFPGWALLINNAAIFEKGRLIETDVDSFDRHMNINLRAPFLLIREFARSVSSGHIINVTDARVSGISPDYAAYSLSKTALFSLTRMAAIDLAPGIRVNAIAPGAILPPPGHDKSHLEPLKEKIPLRMHGSTDNLVSALAYLVENDFVTGQCLTVDGGQWLWK